MAQRGGIYFEYYYNKSQDAEGTGKDFNYSQQCLEKNIKKEKKKKDKKDKKDKKEKKDRKERKEKKIKKN